MVKTPLFSILAIGGLTVFFFWATTSATPSAESEQEMLSEIQAERGERNFIIASRLLQQIKAVKTKSGKQAAYDYLMKIGYRYPYESMMIRNLLFEDIPPTRADDELMMLVDIQLERGDKNAFVAYKYLLQAKAVKIKSGKQGAMDYLNRVAINYPYEAERIRETLSLEQETEKPKKATAKVGEPKPDVPLAKVDERVKQTASPPKQQSIAATTAEIPTTKSDPKSVERIEVLQQTVHGKKFRKKFAVVIGISYHQYKGKDGLTNLLFADDDAKDFSSTLLEVGWSPGHIKLLLNEEATKRNIQIALESWLTKAGENDLIVVFWAGHGFPDPEDPRKVYFACYDTELSIPATGYRMDRVRASLEERGVRNVLFFADTCHAGKLITRGDKENSMAVHLKAMREQKKLPKGWIFMVGAAPDRYALESTSWSNGAFTHLLVEGLKGKADGFESMGKKDGIVTMGELQGYLNIMMPEKTQQAFGVARRPIITTTTGDPDIWELSLYD